MYLLKYILLAIILCVVLNYMPNPKLDNTKIMTIIVIVIAGLWVFENMIMRNRMEGMHSGKQHGYRVPNEYVLQSNDEDYIQSGLQYDHNEPQHPLIQQSQFSKEFMPFKEVRMEIEKQRYNAPGYYLINNGEYDENGIPYDKVAMMIAKSKLHDLYHQHNFNIKWSPHTHIGKARGRMNLEQAQ